MQQTKSETLYDPAAGAHRHTCPRCNASYSCDYFNCTPGAEIDCDACYTDAPRACADCNTWAKSRELVRQTDGRMICRDCSKGIKRKAQDDAQGAFFCVTPSLF